jgi:hypothetical protein
MATPRRPTGDARRWWIPALFVLLLGAGAAAALLAFGGSGSGSTPTQTVVRTVTTGTTVEQTVTTAPPASNPASGASLNNAGFAKMGARDYAGALPLLQQAVQKLDGTGSLDEAYAKYNLAYTLFALGQCANVSSLLDQAQAIEGHRKEIDRLRKQADHQCSRGAKG